MIGFSLYLVAVILRIVYDIRFYLLVLFCVLAGFAQAFWILANIDPNNDFGTIRNSLYHAYLTMLGGMTPTFINSISEGFGTFLLCIFMMVMIIVMLNILIALMGDTFADSRAQGLALWQREKAAIVYDQLFYLSQLHVVDKILLAYGYEPIVGPRWSLFQQRIYHFLNPNGADMPPIEPEEPFDMKKTFAHIHVLKYTSDVQLTNPENKLHVMVEASKDHVRPFTEVETTKE